MLINNNYQTPLKVFGNHLDDLAGLRNIRFVISEYREEDPKDQRIHILQTVVDAATKKASCLREIVLADKHTVTDNELDRITELGSDFHTMYRDSQPDHWESDDSDSDEADSDKGGSDQAGPHKAGSHKTDYRDRLARRRKTLELDSEDESDSDESDPDKPKPHVSTSHKRRKPFNKNGRGMPKNRCSFDSGVDYSGIIAAMDLLMESIVAAWANSESNYSLVDLVDRRAPMPGSYPKTIKRMNEAIIEGLEECLKESESLLKVGCSR